MNWPLALAAGLLALGLVAGAPGLVLLAVLTAGTPWLSKLWSRHGLDGVTYERHLASDRAVWGDRVTVDLTVRNAKLLPLAWLEADDLASSELVVDGHRLLASERPQYGILRHVWTLAPFAEARRQAVIAADQRGRFAFEWVRLTVADVFGRDVAWREHRDQATLIVRPRSVPVRSPGGTIVSFGTRAARRGLIEDPVLFAGVRPFQPGDLRRRVHERATARVGHPVSKRFEPATARHVVVCVDVQTGVGPSWMLAYDEDLVEALAVAAASLARQLLLEGAACGLAVNGWTYSLAQTGFIAPRAGTGQLQRIADLLGRMSLTASRPMARLLADLPGRLPAGTRLIVLSSRDPTDILAAVRRVRASGFEVRLVALGPQAAVHVERARRAGLTATVARLDPDWRTAAVLALAG